MLDDLIYFTTLIFAINLASYYKRIDDLDMRKNYGVGLGLLTALIICRTNIIHGLLLVWGNSLLIKWCKKRYVHVACLTYTWLYLIYLHIRLTNQTYVLWLYQNMALRLVGLAFEMHDSLKEMPDQPSGSKWTKPRPELDKSNQDPSVTDIISYAFFFIGLHKGPYYKWKIYNDHLTSSFGNLGDCGSVTQQKLNKIMIFTLGYSLIRIKFSPSIYYDNDFYVKYDPDTRYLYNIPILLMYYLESQIMMLFCTSVCTQAGFGIYPAKCNPLPGLGPSSRLSLLKLVNSPEVAKDQEYNFAMLKCFDNEKLILGPTMTDTIRGWDMPTRYWFWSNIYQNLFNAHRDIRGTASFLMWTLWCGPSLQYIIIGSTIWVYIHLEAVYITLFNQNRIMDTPWNMGFSLMRIFCLIYLTPCLAVTDAVTVVKYYNSIFWVYHFIIFFLIIGAVVIYKLGLLTPDD